MAQAERQHGRPRKLPNGLAVTQQHRTGMPRVDHAETTGPTVQLDEQPGREEVRVLGPHPPVDADRRIDQIEATPTGVAVRADHQRGQGAGLDAVPTGVEEPDAEHVTVQRVVEDVAADVVARFEDGGDHQVVGGEGQRREQAPHDLGRDLHRHPPPHPLDHVAVEPAVDQDLGDVDRHLPGRTVHRLVGGGRRDDLQYAHPLAAEQQWHPHPVRVVGRTLDVEGGERPAGERRLDRQLVPVETRTEQRHEEGLRVVGQIDHDLAGIDPGRRAGDQLRHLVRATPGRVELQPTHHLADVAHAHLPLSSGEATPPQRILRPPRPSR